MSFNADPSYYTVQVADRFSFEPIKELSIKADDSLSTLKKQLAEYFRLKEKRPEYRFLFTGLRVYHCEPLSDGEPTEITDFKRTVSAAGIRNGSRLLVDGARSLEDLMVAIMFENTELRGDVAAARAEGKMSLTYLKKQNENLEGRLKDVMDELAVVKAQGKLVKSRLDANTNVIKSHAAAMMAVAVAVDETASKIERAVTVRPLEMLEAAKPACKLSHNAITIVNATPLNPVTVITRSHLGDAPAHFPNADVKPGHNGICVVEFSFAYGSEHTPAGEFTWCGFTPISNPWIEDSTTSHRAYVNKGYCFDLQVPSDTSGHGLYKEDGSDVTKVLSLFCPDEDSVPSTHSRHGKRIYALAMDLRSDACGGGQIRVYWSDDHGDEDSIVCHNSKRVAVKLDTYIPWVCLEHVGDSFSIHNIYHGKHGNIPPRYMTRL